MPMKSTLRGCVVNKTYQSELEELLQLNGEEPENKCPFQIKKGLAKEWILYNKDTGLNIYHGSHKACNDLASQYNTAWFFNTYV